MRITLTGGAGHGEIIESNIVILNMQISHQGMTSDYTVTSDKKDGCYIAIESKLFDPNKHKMYP